MRQTYSTITKQERKRLAYSYEQNSNINGANDVNGNKNTKNGIKTTTKLVIGTFVNTNVHTHIE